MRDSEAWCSGLVADHTEGMSAASPLCHNAVDRLFSTPSIRMTITFFKSFLCPRCHYTGKILSDLKQRYPELHIRYVDVTIHPLTAWQNGIKIIPALQSENDVLAGIFLGETEIIKFLRAHGPI